MVFVMTNFTPADMPGVEKTSKKPMQRKVEPEVTTPEAQETPLKGAQTASKSTKPASTGKTSGTKKK